MLYVHASVLRVTSQEQRERNRTVCFGVNNGHAEGNRRCTAPPLPVQVPLLCHVPVWVLGEARHLESAAQSLLLPVQACAGTRCALAPQRTHLRVKRSPALGRAPHGLALPHACRHTDPRSRRSRAPWTRAARPRTFSGPATWRAAGRQKSPSRWTRRDCQAWTAGAPGRGRRRRARGQGTTSWASRRCPPVGKRAVDVQCMYADSRNAITTATAARVCGGE